MLVVYNVSHLLVDAVITFDVWVRLESVLHGVYLTSTLNSFHLRFSQ